jgi:voltage-gated potassium channel
MRYDENHHQRTSNYFLLLISTTALVFFPVFVVFFKEYSGEVFRVLASIFIVWGAYVVTQNKRELTFSLALGVLAMIGIWISPFNVLTEWGGVAFRTCSTFAFFTYLGERISRQLIQGRDNVSLNLIYGAIICYMLIGIIGGELCILMDLSIPGTFFEAQDQGSLYRYYYFSFVTLTTVGYGDISPSNEAGQALSLLIGLSGQIYLTIIMAIIIGKYLNRQN